MQKIKNIISETIESLYGIDFSPEISGAPKPELGEYCVNIFPIVKQVGKAPNIISEEVANKLAKHTDVFRSTSATGGYVNFFLMDRVWIGIFHDTVIARNEAIQVSEKQSTGFLHSQEGQKQKAIIVDYIGANAGKPLHIGHICTPSIGQVICNIYRHLGYRVISDSHFGDWGGIFGKLIWVYKNRWKDKPLQDILEEDLAFFKERLNHMPDQLIEVENIKNRYYELDGIDMIGKVRLLEILINLLTVDDLLDFYQEFHTYGPVISGNGGLKFQLDSEQNNHEIGAREEFKKLSQGDPENAKLWKKFTAISLAEIEKKLELLNVHADYNIGESFYEGLGLPRPNGEDYPDLEFNMKDIVTELIKKGIATDNSIASNGEDKSVGVVFPEELKLPSCILQKKDGTGLYLTSDLAAIKYRLTNGWNPEKIIYSVDVRQQLHLRQAFTIAQMAWPELTKDVEFFHAFNGFIKLKEGAMSTRHGTVIFLEKLIEEGNERTAKILEEKGRTGEKALNQDDIQAITVGAIKYSYLAQDREKDVTFDWDKALNFEGNSGPYIQYAYVRAKKIYNTSILPAGELKNWRTGELTPFDKSLIQILARFDEVVDTVAKTYKPHHLALYAYDLAVVFNSFYVHTPKILEEKDEDLKQFRLALVARTTETLEKAFELLAIKMPSEM